MTKPANLMGKGFNHHQTLLVLKTTDRSKIITLQTLAIQEKDHSVQSNIKQLTLQNSALFLQTTTLYLV